MTPAAACLKRHSCEIYLSNYVLDFKLKMPKHFSSILSSFFSNERSRGLHCHSINGDSVLLLPVFFVREKNRFFHVSLQIAPWQGFRNIQANQYKEQQQMGLRR